MLPGPQWFEPVLRRHGIELRKPVGLISSFVGAPFISTSFYSLLTCSRLGWTYRSRGCCRGRSGLSRCCAATALSYVSLLRNAVGLISSFVGAPFISTSFYSLLLRYGVRG